MRHAGYELKGVCDLCDLLPRAQYTIQYIIITQLFWNECVISLICYFLLSHALYKMGTLNL